MAAAAGMTTATTTGMGTTMIMPTGTIMRTTMRHTATQTIMNMRTTRGMPATTTVTGRTGMKHMGTPTPKDADAPATHTRMQTGTGMMTANTVTHMRMTMDASMHTVTGMNITDMARGMSITDMARGMSIMSTRRIIHTNMDMHTTTRMTTHTAMPPQNPPGRP